MRKPLPIHRVLIGPVSLAWLFVACILLAGSSSAATEADIPAPISYQLSWHAGEKDINGKVMCGIELMRILPFKGKLYAANSLWTESDPSIPKACQLLVLDSPDAKWKLFHQFTARNLRLTCLQDVTFMTDGAGNKIKPVEMLLAAPDQIVAGAIQVYSLDDNTDTLAPMTVGTTNDKYADTRAIGWHHDSVTGIDHVFAGNTALGIYRGVYDPKATGRILWQASEYTVNAGAYSPDGERVMGFANCNGILYAATSKHILKRTDGASPTWASVKEYPNEISASGIRGLAAVPNPTGRGQVLLYNCRGNDKQTCVRRLDPANGYAETVELNINADMGKRLGARIPYVLSAYNDFLNCTLPGTRENVWMFGLEMSFTPSAVQQHPEWRVFKAEGKYRPGMSSRDMYYAAEGRYYVRHTSASGEIRYEQKEISDPALPTLVSVRTIAVSPFPADQGKVLYFGGYDANYQPSHNTAWIYRGSYIPAKTSLGPASNRRDAEVASCDPGRTDVISTEFGGGTIPAKGGGGIK